MRAPARISSGIRPARRGRVAHFRVAEAISLAVIDAQRSQFGLCFHPLGRKSPETVPQCDFPRLPAAGKGHPGSGQPPRSSVSDRSWPVRPSRVRRLSQGLVRIVSYVSSVLDNIRQGRNKVAGGERFLHASGCLGMRIRRLDGNAPFKGGRYFRRSLGGASIVIALAYRNNNGAISASEWRQTFHSCSPG